MKKRLSEEEITEQFMAVELWKESGMSQGAFCKSEGLNYNTFRGWVKRYRKTKGLGQKVTQPFTNCFLDVEVDEILPPSSIDHQDQKVTLRYPNGVELSCSLPLALSQNLVSLLD